MSTATQTRPTPVEEQAMRAHSKRTGKPLPKVLQDIDAEEPPYKSPVELQAEQMRKNGTAASVKKADLQKIIVAAGGEDLDETGKGFEQKRGDAVALTDEVASEVEARMSKLEGMMMGVVQAVQNLQQGPSPRAARKAAKKAAPVVTKKAAAKKTAKRK